MPDVQVLQGRHQLKEKRSAKESCFEGQPRTSSRRSGEIDAMCKKRVTNDDIHLRYHTQFSVSMPTATKLLRKFSKFDLYGFERRRCQYEWSRSADVVSRILVWWFPAKSLLWSTSTIFNQFMQTWPSLKKQITRGGLSSGCYVEHKRPCFVRHQALGLAEL